MTQASRKLNEEGRAMWDTKAAFWDELMGEEGNRFHRELIGPAVEALLDLRAGERVLDVACGSGMLARRMASLGAAVTAVDFSAELLKRAQARGQSGGTAIRYLQADATDEEALAAFGEGMFDALTCTMALMDMPEIGPLYRAARRLLKPDGRFVFATMHPAFNSNNPVFTAELADVDGELLLTNALKISRYMDIPPEKGMGAKNEPSPHYYYHRPLHELLGEAFTAGLVLDGLIEAAFDPEKVDPDRLLSWYSFPQIPPVLAGRFRVGK